MRVIITGGTGLIGRHLAHDLARAGHEVFLLSRSPNRVAGLPPGVRAAGWDGRTADGWHELVDGAGAIVNLAGENLGAGRWTAERKRSIRESRINAGQAVTDAIAKAPERPAVVVQASAVGYYGPRGDEEITEKDPAGDDFAARVTIDWESSTQPVEALGVRRVIIRSGVVLSPEGGALPRMLLPFRLFAGGPLGSGRQWMPWIHMADEVQAIRFLLDHPDARGAFNLTAPQPVTNGEFTRVLGRVLRRPAWLPAPAFALRLILGEMATVVLEGQRAVPNRLVALGFDFRYQQLEPALQNLLN